MKRRSRITAKPNLVANKLGSPLKVTKNVSETVEKTGQQSSEVISADYVGYLAQLTSKSPEHVTSNASLVEKSSSERSEKEFNTIDMSALEKSPEKILSPTQMPTKQKSPVVVAVKKTDERKKPFQLYSQTMPENLDRSKLTMREFVHFNPTSKPMSNANEKINRTFIGQVASSRSSPVPDDTPMPVPQIKIGADGNIELSQESLVIKQKQDQLNEMSGEELDSNQWITSSSFKKRNKCKRWSKEETVLFYKALAVVGPDFSMIKTLFPNRSREEVRNKFRQEDRFHRTLITKAIMSKKSKMEDFHKLFGELEDIAPDTSKKDKKKSKKKTSKRRKFKKDNLYQSSDSEPDDIDSILSQESTVEKTNSKLQELASSTTSNTEETELFSL